MRSTTRDTKSKKNKAKKKETRFFLSGFDIPGKKNSCYVQHLFELKSQIGGGKHIRI